ncbi:MAG: chromosomal replication initiator protein DnaA [Saprospiraceae bacterium]|nr:chromosomal replication initiator protein DnaA [Saprospiraceae bacterium]HMW38034.1 chromosomal replication initiator protein DnaA [Saprospiraceae bacterium]HMX86996.1 chromosomal replication initiator protein DnaA [Saprospiraceae bacterium]HMZ39825.1 chromosomal replication initiator protein DnaA [Saprospiraceae bacterium]HNB30185.1 chromosomal replication initiator protein DnaA [Saprospiraceae bacterium]
MNENSAVTTWNHVLEEIRRNISPKIFNTWFIPIKPLSFEGHVLTLEVPNEFFLGHLESNYLIPLKEALRKVLGPRTKLAYQLAADDYRNPGKVQKSTKAAQDDSGGIKNPFVIPGIRKQPVDSNLNPKYTFDNFIEGHCNRVARQAGLQIANKPGDLFNPLLLYGETGLGKSHLLQAIGNALVKKHQKMQVMYTTSDRFTNQFIQAIRNNSTNEFAMQFQNLDCLLIDDIQYFAGKAGTQEIFFHLFNQLHQQKKQIVLTSDKAPKDLKEIDDRLISRFKWGASLELQSPDYETLMAILQTKCQEKDLQLEPSIMEVLCLNLKQNIRELEGILVNLKLQSTVNQMVIDNKLVREVLQSFSNQVNKELTVDGIAQIISEQMKVPMESILGKGRKRNIVQARQLCMYFAKKLTNKPLSAIGEALGGKDHSTVIYSCDMVETQRETDPSFDDLVKKLEKIITKTLGVK